MLGRILRLALDQNFPMPLLRAVADFLPTDIEVRHVRAIDVRLSDLDDRPLLLALKQLGWDGLITNNYKMLEVPEELAAIIRTQAVVVAIVGLGHDPIRGVGALLLELPGMSHRVLPRRSNVFRVAHRTRQSADGREFLAPIAERRGQTVSELLHEVEISREEFDSAGLSD